MRDKNAYKDKITMKFNTAQLERIIIALLNNSFNRKFVSNVMRLFSLFNPSLYKLEYEKDLRVYIVKELCKIILENDIEGKEGILSFLDTDGKYYNDAVELLNGLYEEEIPETELALLDKQISNQIRYSIIIEKSDELSDQLLNLKAENYDSLEDAIKQFGGILDTMSRDVKSARESLEDSKKDMSLSNGAFINSLEKIIMKERNPGYKIKTPLQFLNRMFNGGFEPGRTYVVMAPPKGWKSGFMLNMASAAKRYNRFQTHNKNLKPVIVYLTMENTTEETITRLWAHCFGNDSVMANYDPVTAAGMLEKAGIFTPNDPESPELLIWYRANRSITTSDLNAMLEDLKTEGKECVFLVLDYIRRIKPAETNKDLRLELSNVANELKTIAMEQDIPILTRSQLNRDALKTIEDAESFDAKVRASDKIGASNVSESLDIIMNCDYAFTINKLQKSSYNEDGDVEYTDKYLFIKLIACRGKNPNVVSFKHRFADNNDMRLIEDINMPRPISTLTDLDLIKNRVSENGQKSKGPRQIIQ